MSRVKFFEEESLPESATATAMELRINVDNIFNPLECFTDKGDFQVPKNIKLAYLVYTDTPRKLQRVHIETYVDYSTGKIYGAWANADKTEKKKWVITTHTTKIDLTKKDDAAFFAACCCDRQVAGTARAFPKPIFRIEVPEMRFEKELEQYESLEMALSLTSKMTEADLDDMALMMNVTSFANKTLSEKKAYMRKLATTNSEEVVNAVNNKKNIIILTLKRAEDKKIIKNIKGVYSFADHHLGTTIEQAINWCEQNQEIFELIKNSLDQKK